MPPKLWSGNFDEPADPLAEGVIYVGEGKFLRRRWKQFERSAHLGKNGHSGGHTYAAIYQGRFWDELHVAAFPVWFGEADTCDPQLRDTYRLALERAILLQRNVKLGSKNKLLNKK